MRYALAVGSEGLLVCTGADFVDLWRDALRRGLTPFIRRALDARRAILVAGLEAVREEPVAQGELARLVTPERLVILAGCSHLRHLVAGSPTLAMPLAGAASLCLHEGPCVSDGEAWALIDRVAGYYALSRAALLSRRRTAQIALARQVAMYVLRAAGLTYDRVGQLLGRDHATVLHGCRRIQQISMRDRLVRHDLAALCPAVPAA